MIIPRHNGGKVVVVNGRDVDWDTTEAHMSLSNATNLSDRVARKTCRDILPCNHTAMFLIGIRVVGRVADLYLTSRGFPLMCNAKEGQRRTTGLPAAAPLRDEYEAKFSIPQPAQPQIITESYERTSEPPSNHLHGTTLCLLRHC